MNVVREINKINERELELGLSGSSWHDEYKDSAYVFVGGLHFDLTEGDVITIFSQYGEVMDVNLPRDKETGKTKGFGFLMYEDQRSTVLAVDNLNGANVLERTLRVDHVRQYKQQKEKGADGELVEKEEQSLNAKPEMIVDDASSESSPSSGPEIDPEDPMAPYLLQKRKEEKASKKTKRPKVKSKGKYESPEERRARKERKRAKKEKKITKRSDGLRGVEDFLQNWGYDKPAKDARSRSRSPTRRKLAASSRSPNSTQLYIHRGRGDSRSPSRLPEHQLRSHQESERDPEHPKRTDRDSMDINTSVDDVRRHERSRDRIYRSGGRSRK